MCDIVVHSKVLVRVKLFGDVRGSCMRFDKSSGTGLSAEKNMVLWIWRSNGGEDVTLRE
jgi:hypothetical protein